MKLQRNLNSTKVNDRCALMFTELLFKKKNIYTPSPDAQPYTLITFTYSIIKKIGVKQGQLT